MPDPDAGMAMSPSSDSPATAVAPRARRSAWWRALRPHQWSKNLLVFVPAVASHRYGDPATMLAALAMFVAMGLAASAIYLVNDITDRHADRRHARKRLRPFAAGELAPEAGAAVAVALVALAAALAAVALPSAAAVALATYVVIALGYSFVLKRWVVVDVGALAVLYVLRVLAGGAAIAVDVSPWLLALSFALFASLALAKRYAEVSESDIPASARLPGRGYGRRDLGWLRTAGWACAAASSLIIAFYAASLAGSRYYAHPSWLYALAPIVFVWLARVWTRAGDGRMHDDPVVDAATDPMGLAIVAAGVATFVAAL